MRTRGSTEGGDHNSSKAALKQLRLRLLDLTGRNRLLNFRHSTGRSLQFVEGQPGVIYEKLVEGKNRTPVTIDALPEPARRDWIERNGRLSRPDALAWASQHRIPTSYDLDDRADGQGASTLRALLYMEDLAKHCRKIEREAVLAIEETGANMLFLVMGFLDYPDQRDSDRSFSAPLISIPVALSRQESAGNQTFSLQYTGDDVSENLSLREKLKSDHDLIFPELAEDEIDVEAYFLEIGNIIKDRPRLALRRRTSLCLLSFTNMLMVRDLDPAKWPMFGDKHSFLDHPIIREIFHGAEKHADARADWGIAPEHDVENGSGARIPLVFDADSSQHSALVDVLAQQKNVVIEGPPGTGKSQTITNLIAASLAEGKKVLFVAEKLAAFEVVKARLTRAGLDAFLLELHSNKTNKKRVLEELAKRVHYRPNSPSNLPRKLQELEHHRKDLRDYCDVINSVTHNALGKTLHQVMWRSERYRMSLSIDHRPLMQRLVPGAPEMSELELSRRMDCLRHLGDQYRQITGFHADCPFWGFFPDPIVPGEEIRLRQIFLASREWAERFVRGVCDYDVVLGKLTSGLTLDDAATQLQALGDLSARADHKLPLHLIPLLFRGDKTGLRIQRRLEAFSDQTVRYRDLAPVVAQAIHSEDAVTRHRLDALRTLERTATSLGATLRTQVEMSALCSQLLDECERLETALTAIDTCCGQIGIPFDGSRSQLALLSELARTIAGVPTELLHLQSEELTREGSSQAIEALARLQREWTALASDLDALLYLDALPPEETLRQAVLTFREGEAWYRIFQARWRAAIATHKSLQRTKRRVTATHRLAELERVTELMQVKERWKADPAWLRYVRCAVPPERVPLDECLALAAWNRSVKLLLEDLGTPVFAPAELTPENARALRRTFREFGTHLTAATCALATIDRLLPASLTTLWVIRPVDVRRSRPYSPER